MMQKKPRMPKNVQPVKLPQQADETEDEVVIAEDPAPVTKIFRASSDNPGPGPHVQEQTPPAEEPAPAPRVRMRQRLWESAKNAQRKSKKPRTKRVSPDIWDRTERATSFDNDPQPARQFSGRTVALLSVLFIAALIMAQPLQLLLEQQADIAQARQQLSQEQQREQELQTQLERWEDPAYVQQQARERFNMVMPGERKYLVIGDEAENDSTEQESNVATVAEDIEMGWADRLWGSVVNSGQE